MYILTFFFLKKMNDRLFFIDNLKSGNQKIHVNNDTYLTLFELFAFLETNHSLKPFAQGNEGKVFKFGHPDHPFSFIVKVIEKPKQNENMEAFFAKWLSEEVTEKEKSNAFPFFIAQYKNMIAFEFIDFASLYPYYLFQHLISENEQKFIQKNRIWKEFQTIIQPSDITPMQRNLCIKSLFLQAIHGLYLIQGVNLHGFRHRDLHGQNVMIRKRTKTREPFVLTVFLSNQLMDIVLPDFGIELIISDFGLSSYPGIGEDNQMKYPLSDEIDLEKFFVPWISTFQKLEWKSLEKETEELLQIFRRKFGIFPNFEIILNADMFKDVFVLQKSKKNPIDLYVAPPLNVKRFTKTKTIAKKWFSQLETNVEEIRKNYDPSNSDIDEFVRRTEIYLKVIRSLNVLMNTQAGLNKLINRIPLPIEDIDAMINNLIDYKLSDFNGSNLDDILNSVGSNLGVNGYLMAFAILNNLISF